MPANLTFVQKSKLAVMYVQQFAPYQYTTGDGRRVRELHRLYPSDDASFEMAGHRFTTYSALRRTATRRIQTMREWEWFKYEDYRDSFDRWYQQDPIILGDTAAGAQNEWTLYIQPNTVFDQRVQELFNARYCISAILTSKSSGKLKRIEAQGPNDPKPEIIWLRA